MGLVFVVGVVLLVHTVTVVRTARSNFGWTGEQQLAVILTRLVILVILVILTLLTLLVILVILTHIVILALFSILVILVILAIRDEGA